MCVCWGEGEQGGNSAAVRTPNNPLGTRIDRGDPGQRLKRSHLPPLTPSFPYFNEDC